MKNNAVIETVLQVANCAEVEVLTIDFNFQDKTKIVIKFENENKVNEFLVLIMKFFIILSVNSVEVAGPPTKQIKKEFLLLEKKKC